VRRLNCLIEMSRSRCGPELMQARRQANVRENLKPSGLACQHRGPPVGLATSDGRIIRPGAARPRARHPRLWSVTAGERLSNAQSGFEPATRRLRGCPRKRKPSEERHLGQEHAFTVCRTACRPRRHHGTGMRGFGPRMQRLVLTGLATNRNVSCQPRARPTQISSILLVVWCIRPSVWEGQRRIHRALSRHLFPSPQATDR